MTNSSCVVLCFWIFSGPLMMISRILYENKTETRDFLVTAGFIYLVEIMRMLSCHTDHAGSHLRCICSLCFDSDLHLFVDLCLDVCSIFRCWVHKLWQEESLLTWRSRWVHWRIKKISTWQMDNSASLTRQLRQAGREDRKSDLLCCHRLSH